MLLRLLDGQENPATPWAACNDPRLGCYVVGDRFSTSIISARYAAALLESQVRINSSPVHALASHMVTGTRTSTSAVARAGAPAGWRSTSVEPYTWEL